MHSSRLQVVLIDSPPEVADAEIAFWAAALGREVAQDAGSPFALLAALGDGLELAHQRLGQGQARIHLDIETDDTAAEAQRLEDLGAVRVGEQDGCIHLRDPAGLVLCVVPVQTDDFEEHATRWP
jgi:catechol 2,3-dioxygenase-like lactoylglutathione lyase family enzyme